MRFILKKTSIINFNYGKQRANNLIFGILKEDVLRGFLLKDE